MDLYKTNGIYGIKNIITGSVYVGQTVVNFGDRRDSHYSLLRHNKHSNKLLQSEWNEYGENSFEFLVLHRCDDDVCNIDDLEKKYINIFRTIGSCYNIADGGKDGLVGHVMSDNTKKLIGEKNRVNMTGKIASDATKEKMSKSQMKRFASMTAEDLDAWGKMMSEVASGYKWSEDSKNKFSERQKTKPNGAKYDVDTVHKIRKMHEEDGLSIREIADSLGMNRATVRGIAKYERWKYV